jgi:hypothetical protein
VSDRAVVTAVGPFERQLACWQGKIATAAKQGTGLDIFQAALNWVKRDVPTGNGLREQAKQELLETAERHLDNVHGAAVVDASYYDIFPDEDRERDAGTSASNDELDAKTIEDNRNQIKAKIKRLANLPVLEYAQDRKAAAQELGVGVGALDSAVKAERDKAAREQTDFLPHWNVEQWPDPINGAALLTELRKHFRRYVVLPKHADVALSLWVLHTWVFDCFDIAPYLAITSPTRRCGKTLLMTVLYWLCCRAKKNDSMSKAAIYRSVESERPTLLLDETSWVVDLKDERQGILCGGFERNGFVEVCEGDSANITVRRYSTYCPKAFGIIGKLTATLMDRAIQIAMQRKTKGESVKRLRRRDNADHARLRQQCLRWANDNRQALLAMEPKAPDGLNDRALDFWEPLLAIAEQVGGDWPKLAREAAIILSGGEAASDERSVELLADIKAIFDANSLDEITTKALLAALCAAEERPWATYNKGKAISDRQVAKLLKQFSILSETIHPLGEKDAKGYKRDKFRDAFDRYLTPSQGVENAASAQFGGPRASKRPNADERAATSDFSVRPESSLDGCENSEKPAKHGQNDGKTDKNRKTPREELSGRLNGGNRAREFRCEIVDASDGDRGISAFLDQRDEPHGHRVCVQCGKPGGTEWKYDGVKVRLHSYCEQPWIESYEAKLSKASQPNNDGHCDGVTVAGTGISKSWSNGVSERRCSYCGRTGGELQETYYGEVSALLHRGCQGAWRADYDDLDIRNQSFYRSEA